MSIQQCFRFTHYARSLSTKKIVPITGQRVIPVFFCMQVNRKEEEETEQQQIYQFIQRYNILHSLQVHLQTLTVIIHKKYIRTLYLYIHIYVLF